MLKHLDTLKSVAHKAQESAVGTAQRAQESVTGTVQRAQSTVTGTVQRAQTVVVETIEASTQSAKNAVLGTVESTVLTAKDAVLDAKDDALGTVVRKVGTVADIGRGVILPLGEIGMFVAPVPVAIGLCLLEIAEWQFGGSLDKIESDLEKSKGRRKFDRQVGLLQKYGKIPATALLQSQDITLEIESKPFRVSGSVKTGKLVGSSVEALETHDLEHLLETCKDQDTQEIVKAYQKLRTISGAH